MVGRICPPGCNRVKVSQNLGATPVAPVAPVDTSLNFYGRIGNFHTNRIILIILGEHYNISVFDFFLPNLELWTEVLSSKTLTKDKSPYKFNHDVLVKPEGELIVEPGVELQFAPEAGIIVRGVFNAEGTSEETIKFDSYERKGKSFLKNV